MDKVKTFYIPDLPAAVPVNKVLSCPQFLHIKERTRLYDRTAYLWQNCIYLDKNRQLINHPTEHLYHINPT